MEVWKPVVGYENLYEVSSLGRVRSLPREVKHYTGKLMLRRGGEIKGTKQRYVLLNLCRDGQTKTIPLHKIVAEAFHGPRPTGAIIRHKDGDRYANTAENICYGTHQENSDDMRLHGTVLRGEAHGCSKATEKIIRTVRESRGVKTQRKLAEETGMSVQWVQAVQMRKIWQHLL